MSVEVTTTAAGYRAIEPAQALQRAMGDPADDDEVLSYARSAELDASEVFPTAACARLDALGLPRHYVPARHGGALTSYEEVLHLMRVLARRDLTLAIAHGKTFLGAVGVWVAGRPDQQADLAADILAGARVCWGLTERAHGSDLLAGEVSAQRTPTGYRVDGEKWLINNATRGDLVCLLARTEPTGGPRGFSLLLVDKRQLAPDRYRCLPKVRTHGIRAADISGISFHDAEVPATHWSGRWAVAWRSSARRSSSPGPALPRCRWARPTRRSTWSSGTLPSAGCTAGRCCGCRRYGPIWARRVPCCSPRRR